MAQKEKNSFVLYYDYRQHLALLDDEQRGRLFMALFDYAECKTEPELEGAVLMAFSFIRAQMDRDAEKYAEKCRKRSEAGKQGGRPPKATETEDEEEEPTKTEEKQTEAKKANGFSEKQTEAKKTDTDTDNENGTDTDTDNDNENGTDTDTDSVKENKKKKSGKAAKLTHGAYNNVLLTEKEYQAIKEEHGEILTECAIQLLDEYIEEKGYKSKSHYLSIKRWVIDALKERQEKRGAYKAPASFDDDEFFQAAVNKTKRQRQARTAAEDEVVRARAEDLRRQLSGQ